MSLEQIIGTAGFGAILLNIGVWFIKVCAFGFIMKHFIREAIKEAMDDRKPSKRNTEQDW